MGIRIFPRKDGPKLFLGRDKERDFHGEKLKNDPHASTTDPDARLLIWLTGH